MAHGNPQVAGPGSVRARGWLGRGLARVFGKGRCPAGGKGRDDSDSDRDREIVIQGLTQTAARNVCPDKAADKARSILAGMGIAVLLGCAGSAPPPRYTAQAKCVIEVLVRELGQSELVDRVILEQTTLHQALEELRQDPTRVFLIYEAMEA